MKIVCIFANVKTKKSAMTTKEDVLARFQEARQRKRDCIARLEKSMKADYEKRTGKSPDYFFAL